MQPDAAVMIYALAAFAVLASLSFSVITMLNSKAERTALLEMHKMALLATVAKSARDVTEAKALENFEAEALRQHKQSYEEFRKNPPPPPPPEKMRAVDSRGNEFEVMTGLD